MKPNKAGSKKKPCVLIVDDEEIALEATKGYMEDFYEVLTARDGQQALDACKKRLPDAIVMDLMMPTAAMWEGDAAINLLGADPRTAKIPVIIHTGFTGVRGLNLKAIGSNVAAVLLKPTDLGDMKKQIDAVMR